MKLKICCCILFLVRSFLCGQTPADDPNWILDFQDDFQSLNTNVWNNPPDNTWGLETFSANNVSTGTNGLTLTCNKVNNQYISGGITSVNKKSFSYGYFEAECKIPKGKGYWTPFWMHYGVTQCDWHEIDVFEPDGLDCITATQYHRGTRGLQTGSCTDFNASIISGSTDFSANFNKFSVIWTPNMEVFYSNNTHVYQIYNSPALIPSHSMFVFFTFQISATDPPDQTTAFPAEFKIKNFKYYKLKTDCNTQVVQSNFNFSTFDYKVKKLFSLSNSTTPSTGKVFLHATDYIVLDAGFTVAVGGEFTAITHNICPN